MVRYCKFLNIVTSGNSQVIINSMKAETAPSIKGSIIVTDSDLGFAGYLVNKETNICAMLNYYSLAKNCDLGYTYNWDTIKTRLFLGRHEQTSIHLRQSTGDGKKWFTQLCEARLLIGEWIRGYASRTMEYSKSAESQKLAPQHRGLMMKAEFPELSAWFAGSSACQVVSCSSTILTVYRLPRKDKAVWFL